LLQQASSRGIWPQAGNLFIRKARSTSCLEAGGLIKHPGEMAATARGFDRGLELAGADSQQ
jgi:hypothetical protein